MHCIPLEQEEVNFGKHTLKLEEVRAFFINIWSFSFQDFIQTLALQAAASYCEVHKRNTRAEVWWEFNLSQET